MLTEFQRKLHEDCDCGCKEDQIIFNPICFNCKESCGSLVFSHKGEKVLCNTCLGELLREIYL